MAPALHISNSSTFREGHRLCARDDEVGDDPHVDRLERLLERHREHSIGRRRLRDAARVVVGAKPHPCAVAMPGAKSPTEAMNPGRTEIDGDAPPHALGPAERRAPLRPLAAWLEHCKRSAQRRRSDGVRGWKPGGSRRWQAARCQAPQPGRRKPGRPGTGNHRKVADIASGPRENHSAAITQARPFSSLVARGSAWPPVS